MFSSLTQAACHILETANVTQKAEQTLKAYHAYHAGEIKLGDAQIPPAHPARPEKPELISPSRMPKRSTGIKGKIGLLHAIAHIELNAIDLAWDMIARFAMQKNMPQEFAKDWLKVAHDEAVHFTLLNNRLEELGASYGDLPAHDGLWEAADHTKDNLGARLAVVPMVLEARGLDVTPKMIEQLKSANDPETVKILQRIYDDEITHVYIGVKWFEYVVGVPIEQATDLFHDYLKRYFRGSLIPPFNVPARDSAEMPQSFYQDYIAHRVSS